jgi:hypothetical protein
VTPPRGPRLAAVAVAVASLACTGCGLVVSGSDFSDEVGALRRNGVELTTEESIHVGPLLMSLGRRFVTEDGADEEIARVAMKAISSVDVGVFRVANSPENIGLLLPSFAGDGWEPIVRLRSRTDNAQVLVRESRGKLRGLMVAALDGEELTLVRLHGDLEPLLQVAIAGELGTGIGK